MTRLIGKFPINPFFFITGKAIGYILWLIVVLKFFNLELKLIPLNSNQTVQFIAFTFFAISAFISVISMLNLGSSLSLGVPKEKTTLKTKGLYHFSRNPIYVSFNLFTIAGVLLIYNIPAVIAGIYSMIVYDYIIKAEEKYLSKKFGKKYTNYCKKVRRYL